MDIRTGIRRMAYKISRSPKSRRVRSIRLPTAIRTACRPLPKKNTEKQNTTPVVKRKKNRREGMPEGGIEFMSQPKTHKSVTPRISQIMLRVDLRAVSILFMLREMNLWRWRVSLRLVDNLNSSISLVCQRLSPVLF